MIKTPIYVLVGVIFALIINKGVLFLGNIGSYTINLSLKTFLTIQHVMIPIIGCFLIAHLLLTKSPKSSFLYSFITLEIILSGINILNQSNFIFSKKFAVIGLGIYSFVLFGIILLCLYFIKRQKY